jgi:hypothetical protein
VVICGGAFCAAAGAPMQTAIKTLEIAPRIAEFLASKQWALLDNGCS